jgi:hypothetical protein
VLPHLQVLYHPDHAHAEFLFDSTWQDVILASLRAMPSRQQVADVDPKQLAQAHSSAAASAAAAGAAANDGGCLVSLDDLAARPCKAAAWRRFLERSASAAAAAASEAAAGPAEQGNVAGPAAAAVADVLACRQAAAVAAAAAVRADEPAGKDSPSATSLSATNSTASSDTFPPSSGSGVTPAAVSGMAITKPVARRHTLPADVSSLLTCGAVDVAAILSRAAELAATGSKAAAGGGTGVAGGGGGRARAGGGGSLALEALHLMQPGPGGPAPVAAWPWRPCT